MKKKRKRQKKYSEALKHEVVKKYQSGEYTYSSLAEEYGLANRFVAIGFMRWFKRNYDIESMSKEEGLKPKTATGEEKQELLEQQLAAAKLKIESLEKLIQVAEEELKINITKKSGTKQSK